MANTSYLREYIYTGEDIIKELQIVLKNIEIKYSYQANKYETADSKRYGDMYITAKDHISNIYTYTEIELSILLQYFSYDDIIKKNYRDPKNLPSDLVSQILYKQDEYVVYDYENNERELNNYYRVLNGVPEIGQPPLFAPIDFYTNTGISPDTPVHKLSNVHVTLLKQGGYYDIIKAENPDAKYLDNLGEDRISYYTSRQALDYSIIRLSENVELHETFRKNFLEVYETVREYYMTAIYNSSFIGQYEAYPNLIGLSIMMMTINNMITMNFKSIIKRELFDLSTIRLLYSAYNLPFIDTLPLDFHKNMINNINYLLQYKSTNKVLLNILDIFGYTSSSINKYFLIKKHKLDEDGNPIFIYKDDPDNPGKRILDKEKMYELSFQSVDITSENVAEEINDPVKSEAYNIITKEDPYWVEDEQLKELIYDTNFNYVETKYLGLASMYISSKSTFNITYAIRMLLDTKDKLSNYTINIPDLFDRDEYFTIFDLICFLNALLAKRNGLKGTIFFDISKVYAIKGYNFKKDISKILNDIERSEFDDKESLLNILKYIYINGELISTVDNTYNTIITLYDFIRERMRTTHDIDIYMTYREVYNALLICEENKELFSYIDNKTGTSKVYNTYLEYLSNENPVLSNYVINVLDNEVALTMEKIIARIEKILPSIKNLNNISSGDNILYDALVQFLMYFKSYTTDLIKFTTFMIFDDFMDNNLKILDKIHHYKPSSLQLKGYLSNIYDTLHGIHKEYRLNDQEIKLTDNLQMYILENDVVTEIKNIK